MSRSRGEGEEDMEVTPPPQPPPHTPPPPSLFNIESIKLEPVDDEDDLMVESESPFFGIQAIKEEDDDEACMPPPPPPPARPRRPRTKKVMVNNEERKIITRSAARMLKAKKESKAKGEEKGNPPPPKTPPVKCVPYQTPEFFKSENYLPPETPLSNYIEKRVSGLISDLSDPVLIRELYSDSVALRHERKVRKFLEKYIPTDIPYKRRTLAAFQKVKDGGSFIFFYLHVQEYGSECPSAYRNTINISMLDSVRIFEPREERTRLYYSIINAYINYARKGGMERLFLWACPPMEDEEYVFNNRPKSQKTPTLHILCGWYDNLMKTGKGMELLESYGTLYKWVPKKVNDFLNVFPFFPDDHWTYRLNALVKSMNKLKKTRDGKLIVKITECNSKVKKNLGNKRRKTTSVTVDKYKYVVDKILEEIKAHEKNFIVMKFKKVEEIEKMEEIFMPSRFTASRDKILTFQQKNELMFKDKKNALRSTSAFLQRLNISFTGILCNDCGNTFKSGEKCKVCDLYRCKGCAHVNSAHSHASWMKIVLWKDNSPVLWNKGGGEDGGDNGSEKMISSKTDNSQITFYDNFKVKLEKSPPDPKALQLYGHTQICKKKNECKLCRGIYQLIFKKPEANSVSPPPSSEEDVQICLNPPPSTAPKEAASSSPSSSTPFCTPPPTPETGENENDLGKCPASDSSGVLPQQRDDEEDGDFYWCPDLVVTLKMLKIREVVVGAPVSEGPEEQRPSTSKGPPS